jgi:hypothetical protein
MSPADILKCSDTICSARQARNKAVAALGLAAVGQASEFDELTDDELDAIARTPPADENAPLPPDILVPPEMMPDRRFS